MFFEVVVWWIWRFVYLLKWSNSNWVYRRKFGYFVFLNVSFSWSNILVVLVTGVAWTDRGISASYSVGFGSRSHITLFSFPTLTNRASDKMFLTNSKHCLSFSTVDESHPFLQKLWFRFRKRVLLKPGRGRMDDFRVKYWRIHIKYDGRIASKGRRFMDVF